MNLAELKVSQNVLDSKIKNLASKVFGSCSVESCDFDVEGGVNADVAIHSLGTTLRVFFCEQCLNEVNETKALELFRMTDNVQYCVIANGILKQERVLLLVVEDKSFSLSDIPSRVKGAIGIEKICTDGFNKATVKFTHPIQMIVGEILTADGKRKQVSEIREIGGTMVKSLSGNKTYVYLNVESVK